MVFFLKNLISSWEALTRRLGFDLERREQLELEEGGRDQECILWAGKRARFSICKKVPTLLFFFFFVFFLGQGHS